MYENEAKRLRWLAFNFPHIDEPKDESDKICNCINLYCTEAADAIEELSREVDIDNDALTAMYAAMPRWIPVTERLPEDRYDVLVYAGVMFPYITVGYYDGLWKFSFNDEEIAGSADYWMPLPKSPKEET